MAKKSVRKVESAVSQLGYTRNVSAANLSRQRTYKLAFLIPGGRNAFFNSVRSLLNHLAQHLRADQIDIRVIELDAFDPNSLTQCLWTLLDGEYGGVAIVGLQDASICEPLQRLRDQGVAVVSLVSDLPLPHRAAYVGIDNVVAGRTAARMVGIFHAQQTGCVQVLAGSLDAQDHKDRLAGFRDVLSKDFPFIDVLEPKMTRDNANEVQAALLDTLAAKSSVTAVYNVGAGNAGLVAALEQCPRPTRFFCVVHELVSHSRKALLDGHIDLVIDQRPHAEVNRALNILKSLIDARELPPAPELVPAIYVRDNLPSNHLNSFEE